MGFRTGFIVTRVLHKVNRICTSEHSAAKWITVGIIDSRFQSLNAQLTCSGWWGGRPAWSFFCLILVRPPARQGRLHLARAVVPPPRLRAK